MKNLTLLGLIFFTFNTQATEQSAVEKNGVLKEKLLGNWQCETLYKIEEDLILGEQEKLLYRDDGTFHSVSQMTFYDAEPYEFTYRAETEGTWQLDDNIESVVFTRWDVQRTHSDETADIIAQNAAVKSIEEGTYQALAHSLKETIEEKEVEKINILEITDKMIKSLEVTPETDERKNILRFTATCHRI